MRRILVILNVLLVFLLNAEADKLFFDDFVDMKGWDYIKLPLARYQTKYTIEEDDGNSVLKTFSKNSASSLQSKNVFNVYEYPVVKWRWKTDRVLDGGDVTKKKGDDYPIRIYVNFLYDKETADAGLTFRYNFVKATYGLEIPQYSLNYIIESKKQKKDFYDNPFDPDNSKIIIKRSGPEAAGIWFDESINIVEDFKKTFGFDPPGKAYVAIMSDTDNTAETVSAFVDYIGVFKDLN